MLNVDDIDVYYGDLQALWAITFNVEKGETVVIVGPNGAGKSTTLRTISGLLRPARGQIQFLGESIHTLPPHHIVERGIAHIPEGRRLFPNLSVLDNLKIGAYTKKAWAQKEDTMEWIFQLFEILKVRRYQMAGTLSGGEQQMLAIGRGLMSRPKLLMLDEPSLGLAPKLVLSTFKLIKEINEEGVTVLLVEQNVQQALEFADRGYVLETGRIALKGEGKDLLEEDHVKIAYLGL
ncbi:MAG: ABC transporter ATP-binding protein [Candidatus Heimdallarchaeota archaeon]